MSAAEIVQAIIEHPWLASPAAVWWALRTRLAHTASNIIRAEAWDRRLRAKGVPTSTRRKLFADAAQRDLESS